MWWKQRVYLDYAAGELGNPSSPHEEGRRAKKMLEGARTSIARLLEVQSDDVVFTSGATESNALAIVGYARALRARAGKDAVGRNNMHVLYLPSAHASLVNNVGILAEEGISVEPLPIENYRVDTEKLATMIRPETVLITMEAVCGETGVVWNTREVADVLRTQREKVFSSLARGTAATREEKAFPALDPSGASQSVASKNISPIVLHVDASQAPLTEKMTRTHFGADLMTLDGAKVDVRGIGLLIAHRTIPLEAFYRGGGQERALHPGSEQPESAERFAAALRAAANEREIFRIAATVDRATLLATLKAILPTASITGGRAQAPHIVSLSLPGTDTDYLVALLDEAGFAVSTRSACETDSPHGSRAVLVLTGDQSRAQATLRISWGPSTSTADLARFASALVKAVPLAREN